MKRRGSLEDPGLTGGRERKKPRCSAANMEAQRGSPRTFYGKLLLLCSSCLCGHVAPRLVAVTRCVCGDELHVE